MDERVKYEDSGVESWPTAKIDTIAQNCGECGDDGRSAVLSHDLI